MHLINVHTLTLREFAGSRDLPPYAILSHTWGPEEISFAEFSDPGRPYLAHDGAGLRKIRLTCQKARAAGLDWAWIDTCCIDKSSSAELSEAINSMFKWYRGARVCFAYLDDWPYNDDYNVSNSISTLIEDISTINAARASILGKCRWFSRGWTLQELIAPRHVKFYIDELAKKGCRKVLRHDSSDAGAGQDKNKNVDRRWISIGSKKDLVGALSIVTRIDSPILLSEQSLDSISVAGRMSWAAGRQTSREEDIAYCLMGIFGVNMPMLYGEGSKAFQRLQEEIMRESDDHSLFVWRAKPESARRFPYRGLLADSPDEFVYSEGIEPIPVQTSSHMSVTNRGIMLTLTTESSRQIPFPARGNISLTKVCLNCRWKDSLIDVCGIELISGDGFGASQYMRSNPSQIFRLEQFGPQETFYITKTQHMQVLPPVPNSKHQYCIYAKMVPEISIVQCHGKVRDFLPATGLVELAVLNGGYHKAGLEIELLGSSKRALIMIWYCYDKIQSSWDYMIEGLVTQPDLVKSSFARTNWSLRKFTQSKQRESLDLCFGPYRHVIVTGKMGKVQGTDVYCLNLVDYRLLRLNYQLGSVSITLHSPTNMFMYVLNVLSGSRARSLKKEEKLPAFWGRLAEDVDYL